jgi:uncharacterized protein (DUF427 family)
MYLQPRRTSLGDQQVKIPGPEHPITIVSNPKRIVVRAGGVTIADTRASLTLHEAAYPPVHYNPWNDVRLDLLERSDRIHTVPTKGNARTTAFQTLEIRGGTRSGCTKPISGGSDDQ